MQERPERLNRPAGWIEQTKEEFARSLAVIRDMHFNGGGGGKVVRELTALTDGMLVSAFDRVRTEMGIGGKQAGWALLAVGGYGRAELNPYSDIDIMFLGRRGAPEKDKEFPSGALHLLWDLGLHLGYSVRCAEDCLGLMKGDFTIMTSLMESRFICGDRAIFDDFSTKLKAYQNPGAVEEYVREKLLERTRRHKKFGDSVYLREPNIKEGAGGLRDIHAAMWISRMKHGVDSIDGLSADGIIREKDARRLKGCKDYLLRLRNEMHFLAGHRQDVLTYELQEAAARDFGYTPKQDRMAVENFMRAYYLRARGVREITQVVIEKALEKDRRKWWYIFPLKSRKINERFFVMGKALCMEGDPEKTIASQPECLLEAFSLCQTQGVALSDNLREAVLDHAIAVNKQVRESAGAGRIFLGMLGRIEGLYETLDSMHRLKVLGRYLPEFGAIQAMVQHDLYHMYTVDEHSLIAVRKIQELLGGEGLAYPEFREALLRVKDKHALMLGVLMHDTGKAVGPGHAEQGARLAAAVALRMGMKKEEADKVEFLVRNHLLMAHVSQRRELTDPGVIEKFSRIVDEPELLDMLYLLTYADMSAVGPGLFNDWKMMLLKELHGRASAFLNDPVSALAHEKERLTRLRANILSEAKVKGVGPARDIERFLRNLPPAYVFSVPVDTALRHFTLTRGIKGADIVLDHQHDARGYTNLSIMLHDMPGLLYLSAGALAARNMNILSAQIFTGKDGFIVDTLQVTDYNGKPALDEGLWSDIKASMTRLFRGQAKVEDIIPHAPAYPRRRALRDIPVRVVVDNEASDRFSVLEVYAQDRVGLLFDITRELYRLGVYISSARVDTQAERVVDVFYVSDIFRQKIENKDRIMVIKDTLTRVLAGDAN